MPHTKSAEKRLRQTEKRKKRNRVWVKSVKKEVREVADAVKAGDAAKAGGELVSAQKRLDKAAAAGVIHKNKAARLKSRLVKKVRAAAAAPAKPAAAKG
jgi:small subunit ribosomal protein S20